MFLEVQCPGESSGKCPGGPKIAPSWPSKGHDTPIWTQAGALQIKMPPRCSKIAPSWPKIAPRWPEITPGSLQDVPRSTQDCSKMAPGWLQDGP